MATEKKITSRIQQKHDVAANWAKATNFIPKKGEIIIYDAEYNASGEETQAVRFKIGDGSKTVNNLPFAVIDYSSDIGTLKQKVANNSTAIGALQENTVPKTRKINNKALSSDITLGAADVGVNETTFPGLKKTGTVTGVKMNGTTKNPSSGVVDLGTVITAHQSLDGKQDKITSSNKLAASLVSGLATVATSGSYNDLANIPVINQDLTASGFTPVANTYYKHTGTTTDLYTNGVIYFYNGTKYASLDGSGGGSTAVTEQVTVAVDDWVLDCITYKQVPVNPIEDGDSFGVLYFDTTKTPDFSEINATISAGEVLWGSMIYNAGSSSNPYNPELGIAVRGFPAGKTMNGTTFTSSQWGIEYYKRSPDETVDTYFYATDELSTALGFAASGWQTDRFIDMDVLYVRHTENHFSTSAGRGFFYWDEFISKDGEWEQVPVGSSTIPPFTYRASKTLSAVMGANSAVSLGYSDSASMRECASACVAIGEVPTDSGNGIIFYSVTKPTQAVNLVVEISETTTNA